MSKQEGNEPREGTKKTAAAAAPTPKKGPTAAIPPTPKKVTAATTPPTPKKVTAATTPPTPKTPATATTSKPAAVAPGPSDGVTKEEKLAAAKALVENLTKDCKVNTYPEFHYSPNSHLYVPLLGAGGFDGNFKFRIVNEGKRSIIYKLHIGADEKRNGVFTLGAKGEKYGFLKSGQEKQAKMVVSTKAAAENQKIYVLFVGTDKDEMDFDEIHGIFKEYCRDQETLQELDKTAAVQKVDIGG